MGDHPTPGVNRLSARRRHSSEDWDRRTYGHRPRRRRTSADQDKSAPPCPTEPLSHARMSRRFSRISPFSAAPSRSRCPRRRRCQSKTNPKASSRTKKPRISHNMPPPSLSKAGLTRQESTHRPETCQGLVCGYRHYTAVCASPGDQRPPRYFAAVPQPAGSRQSASSSSSAATSDHRTGPALGPDGS